MAKPRPGRQHGYSSEARIYDCQACDNSQITYPPMGEVWQAKDFDNSVELDFGWIPITPSRKRWLCPDHDKEQVSKNSSHNQ